jgi:hypothetical protein
LPKDINRARSVARAVGCRSSAQNSPVGLRTARTSEGAQPVAGSTVGRLRRNSRFSSASGWSPRSAVSRSSPAPRIRALVDMGETRALGKHPSGRPWTVDLEDPPSRARSPDGRSQRPRRRDLQRLRHAIQCCGALQPHLRSVERADKRQVSQRLRHRANGHCGRRPVDAVLSDEAGGYPRHCSRLAIKVHLALPDGSRLVQPT